MGGRCGGWSEPEIRTDHIEHPFRFVKNLSILKSNHANAVGL